MKLFQTVRAALATLLTAEGRRAWALVLLAGAGVAMTAYAAGVLYLIREHPRLAFYLGLSAHFLILVVVTGYAGLLVKRSIVAQFGENRRLSFEDQAEAAALAADRVAGAADRAAEEVKGDLRP
ncbi:MAG TPA: hypothetical protein VD768_08865 [Sphingomicrobium sp.]|nr:hypothetical protein [Sphingomicrobium sp.]